MPSCFAPVCSWLNSLCICEFMWFTCSNWLYAITRDFMTKKSRHCCVFPFLLFLRYHPSFLSPTSQDKKKKGEKLKKERYNTKYTDTNNNETSQQAVCFYAQQQLKLCNRLHISHLLLLFQLDHLQVLRVIQN